METAARIPHVLLVDESLETRHVLARALLLAGFRVTAEASVLDVHVVRRLAPDCIVHEFLFNRDSHSTRAFLHALRDDAIGAHIPVLLCTVAHEAISESALSGELQSLDVAVLLKPVRIDEFVARVATASAWRLQVS